MGGAELSFADRDRFGTAASTHMASAFRAEEFLSRAVNVRPASPCKGSGSLPSFLSLGFRLLGQRPVEKGKHERRERG
jgi:hypothetical protein